MRFRKGRYLEENFYIRGDGTRVYFFEKDELADIWSRFASDLDRRWCPKNKTRQTESAHFLRLKISGVDRRLLVNRAKKLKMYRCWLQGADL